MKVLVTGAAGFLGSALVERLLARGERDLRCAVRADAGALASAARHAGASLELVRGTLTSRATAEAAVDGVDVVYHLAASRGGRPADVLLDTATASENVLAAAAAAGRRPKLVLVSSFAVYGVADLAPGATLDESTPLEPRPERRDAYAQAKLRQERLFREYAARCGLRLTVLRPGVVYGPGGAPISPRVGLQVAGVFLHLGGDNVLPLTYVESCADAVALAGQRDAADGETYNVVDDDLVTASEFLSRYRREVRWMPAVSVPYRALRLGSLVAGACQRWTGSAAVAPFTPYRIATTWKPARFTNAKVKALGWRPLVPTDEALRRAFAHHRAHAA